jgi:hypothetical protein
MASLIGCAGPAVVDDYLQADGAQMTEYSVEDQQVTLSTRFAAPVPSEERFMVEWVFPDGRVYLRKLVRSSSEDHAVLETSMPIRDHGPARHPGIWHVSLSHQGEKLVERSFEVNESVPSAASGAREFANLAYCGPARWNDPVISTHRAGAVATGRPGAWIGGDVLAAAGAIYSRAVLLTGCAPG